MTLNDEMPKDWKEEIEFWLEDKSIRTKQLYRRHIKKLYKFLIESELSTDFTKLRLGHLKKFGTYVVENEVPSNRRPLIAAVKSLWKHLAAEEIIHKNIAQGLKLPKLTAPTTIERNITPEEVKGIFDAAERRCDIVLLTLLYYGGLRISEAVKVKCKDVVFKEDGNCVLDVIGKGSKFRQIELNKKATEKLRKYIKKDWDENQYLFPGRKNDTSICSDTGARRIKKITKEAGYPHVTCHFFRHGIASHLLQSGVDIGSVSKMLGHSSISTTSLYIHSKKGCISECIE